MKKQTQYAKGIQAIPGFKKILKLLMENKTREEAIKLLRKAYPDLSEKECIEKFTKELTKLEEV